MRDDEQNIDENTFDGEEDSEYGDWEDEEDTDEENSEYDEDDEEDEEDSDDEDDEYDEDESEEDEDELEDEDSYDDEVEEQSVDEQNGDILEEDENLENIKKLQQILQQDPENFPARRSLAMLLLDEGFDKEAKQNLLYLIQYNTTDDELYFNLGIVYEKEGDFESAKEAYINAISISPEGDYFYNYGLVCIELKEYQEAIGAFAKVIENDGNDSNSYFNIGLCYFKLKEYDTAVQYFNKTLELDKEDVYAHFYLGYIYGVTDQKDRAEYEYNKVLELSPDYSWAYYNLGAIAFSEHDDERALYYLNQTLKYNPHDIDAYKLIAKIYIKNSMFDEAKTLIINALDENENNGDLCYTISQIGKYMKDYNLYEQGLTEAINNPDTLTYPIDIVEKELEILQKAGE
ncbi:tetratricopeptide repeat protein [bacterium]|nr:tetratricopeptide repeat protein [bacterium]